MRAGVGDKEAPALQVGGVWHDHRVDFTGCGRGEGLRCSNTSSFGLEMNVPSRPTNAGACARQAANESAWARLVMSEGY